MNRQEARAILELYCPGQETADPQVAAALNLARSDPELSEWLARQQSLDETLRAGLQSVPVPAYLHARLLAEGARLPAPASPWWQRAWLKVQEVLNTPVFSEARLLRSPLWRSWPMRASLVTALVALAATPPLVSHLESHAFTRFLDEIVEASWDEHRHVHFKTNDLAAARVWLQSHGIDGAFEVPPALTEDTLLNGVRALEWKGQKLALLCYLRGPQHVHLLVGDLPTLTDPVGNAIARTDPRESLHMWETQGWTTFSWIQDHKAYVVSGLHMKEFLKRFRKDRRWTFDSQGPAAGRTWPIPGLAFCADNSR